MFNPLELIDLRTNLWGDSYDTAGERFLELEKIVDGLKHMTFPTVEPEPHTPGRVYQTFTFVRSESGDIYVSIQKVPSGISILNTNYWVRWEIATNSTTGASTHVVDFTNDVSCVSPYEASNKHFCKYGKVISINCRISVRDNTNGTEPVLSDLPVPCSSNQPYLFDVIDNKSYVHTLSLSNDGILRPYQNTKFSSGDSFSLNLTYMVN